MRLPWLRIKLAFPGTCTTVECLVSSNEECMAAPRRVAIDRLAFMDEPQTKRKKLCQEPQER
jgi:hypothetical protein